MTGQFLVAPASQQRKNHTHLVFVLDDGENELRFRGFERLQFPAAGNEIEKPRAILKTHEALRAIHIRGQIPREPTEAIAREILVGGERERFELRLMPMLGPHDLFLAPNSE